MPLIPDIVNMIAGAKIFSEIDLKYAFNQVPVLYEHQKYTAFGFHKGVFEHKGMPFGLQNSPAVFQRMIDHDLGDLVGSCCVAYVYDILMFSKDRSQHTADIKKALEALSSSDLKLKPSKCEFYRDEFSF